MSSYAEALAWLYGTQERGVKLGLGRMRELLAMLGWQQGDARFLHVAGTNGKGSVCAMLESICRAAGFRTGLFTSPHLVTFRERIRINGEMVSAEQLAEGLTRIRGLTEGLGIQPTFFEITTALALEVFRAAAPEVIVLETGLGGRLDSTNVIRPAVSVITSIGLDHVQILGGTLEAIAGEKAGIIKPGVPVVMGPLPPEAAEVVARTAAELAAPLSAVTEPLSDWAIGLKGEHQRINAAVALRALEAAGIQISAARQAEGLRTVSWPGRFQDTGLGFILDGAHNPQAAARFAETWREEFGERRTQGIVGILNDKDARGICAELAGIASEFLIVPVKSPRVTPLPELVAIASAFRPARACGSLREAMDIASHRGVPAAVTGSLFLVGEALVELGLAEAAQEISAQ
jgi:dihydrofolate synthase/folylpolyglutamate synthase